MNKLKIHKGKVYVKNKLSNKITALFILIWFIGSLITLNEILTALK